MAKNSGIDAIRYKHTLMEIIVVLVVGLVYVALLPANIVENVNNLFENATFPALAGIKDVLGYAVLIFISFIFGVLNYVIVRLTNGKICNALLLLGKDQYDDNNKQSINSLLIDYFKDSVSHICLLLVVAWVIATIMEPSRVFNVGYLILILVALLVVLFKYLSGDNVGGESKVNEEYEEAYKKMFAAGVYQERVSTLEGLSLFTANVLLPFLVLLFSNSIISEMKNSAVLWVFALILYLIEALFQVLIVNFVWKGSK